MLTAAQLGIWAFLISAALCFTAAVVMLRLHPSSQPKTTDPDHDAHHSGWPAIARFFKASPVLVILLAWVSFAVMLQAGSKPVAATTWATQLEAGGVGVWRYRWALPLPPSSSSRSVRYHSQSNTFST